eukprot:gene6929-10652_t
MGAELTDRSDKYMLSWKEPDSAWGPRKPTPEEASGNRKGRAEKHHRSQHTLDNETQAGVGAELTDRSDEYMLGWKEPDSAWGSRKPTPEEASRNRKGRAQKHLGSQRVSAPGTRPGMDATDCSTREALGGHRSSFLDDAPARRSVAETTSAGAEDRPGRHAPGWEELGGGWGHRESIADGPPTNQRRRTSARYSFGSSGFVDEVGDEESADAEAGRRRPQQAHPGWEQLDGSWVRREPSPEEVLAIRRRRSLAHFGVKRAAADLAACRGRVLGALRNSSLGGFSAGAEPPAYHREYIVKEVACLRAQDEINGALGPMKPVPDVLLPPGCPLALPPCKPTFLERVAKQRRHRPARHETWATEHDDRVAAKPVLLVSLRTCLALSALQPHKKRPCRPATAGVCSVPFDSFH